MNKLPIAAAGIVAMLTTSVLFAYAEPSERVIPAQNDAVHYCRTNLQDEEQLLYDALLQCALSEDPTVKGTEFQVNTDPASDAFRTEFRRSYNALLFDHPELFWLAVRDSSFQYSYRRRLLDEGAYYISFQLTESFPERDARMQELESAADAFLTAKAQRAARLGERLDALNPLKVLERGYALVLSDEKPVTRAAQAPEHMKLRFADGTVPVRREEA